MKELLEKTKDKIQRNNSITGEPPFTVLQSFKGQSVGECTHRDLWEVACPYIWSSAYYRFSDYVNLFLWTLFHWLSKERVVLVMFMVLGNDNNGNFNCNPKDVCSC